MAKKKVFVSFDYENDRRYKNMLEAWNKNPNFEFVFEDRTSGEIKSDDVSRVKAALTNKIKSATHTLAIIGKYANEKHKDSELIGDINWINWEINKSKDEDNKIVGVKIDRSYESPDAIKNCGASWAMSFTQEAIIRALNEA